MPGPILPTPLGADPRQAPPWDLFAVLSDPLGGIFAGRGALRQTAICFANAALMGTP